MQYFSTNRNSPNASFREAVLRGQPDDKGLYFPSQIPRLPDGFVASLGSLSNAEIAFEVMLPYVDGEIDEATLRTICEETVDFKFPLVPINDGISTLELFHGPTLAFKDVGARFMSRCLQHFSRHENRKTIVIVATSGDTGSAVAAGFHGVEGIEVVILYPKGRVSKIQELQLTTLGGNVTTLELHGSFDDCQALAKQALADGELAEKASFTSANSINVARWLPQQVYYFYAVKQMSGEIPVMSVPSGNFGNLASGVLAKASGLPIKKFIAACNANDVVPRFLASGKYDPRQSVATLSNAMDVGAPSNFVRILEIFGNDHVELADELTAASVSDEETAATMREVYKMHGYTLDPHGGVAYRALADYLDESGLSEGIFLETAHPVKFHSVEKIIGIETDKPEAVRDLVGKKKVSTEISNNYDELRSILLSKV